MHRKCLLLTQSGHPSTPSATLICSDTMLVLEPRGAMRRRDFIKVIVGWRGRVAADDVAQQPPTPVIGFLRSSRADKNLVGWLQHSVRVCVIQAIQATKLQ